MSRVVTIYTTRFNIQQFYVLLTPLYLCVLCGSQNKQRSFPYTTLTDWFFNRDGVCLLRGTSWIFKYNSGYFLCLKGSDIAKVNSPNMSRVVTIYTTRFDIHKLYVLPTQLYLCVLCGSENKQRLFPYTALTDWFL